MATEVVIPMLGVTVEKGKILEWLKKEGDPVEKGESIFVVEADKVTTEVEAPASGILARILLEAGREVPVLTVVGIITAPGEVLPDDYRADTPGEPSQLAAAPAAETAPPVSTPAPAPAEPKGPLRAVPAARKQAREAGIALESLRGTGPDGVICLADVERALAAAPAGPKASPLARKAAEALSVPLGQVTGTGVRGRIVRSDVGTAARAASAPGLGKTISMGAMRQTIARRMAESAFTAPHIYFFADVGMDALLDYRRRIQTDFEARFAIRLSVNDLLIKAVALNILDFPLLNASMKNAEIHICPEVNIGLAVALDDGLIVPAVAGADTAGLADIARQRADLVDRARRGRLTMDEIERGTFTISSMAQYDITHFTAILNPPQSGILSVGSVRDELYLDAGTVKSRKIVTLGLSVDHRIVDGKVAADFLQNLKRRLENPLFTFTRV
ncbi:MAG: 2-oxo acid dehydrogenase subunit E2 [Proteobacteria bacterium]|nr:2-oxo acid dehydrogenase subunit E2 [Pseudomonadota bacterium]MBU2226302.1 2-oxo acid dehydrogenase subunit E2 [Pseudomonadota bacterium]MBU2261093.1 2-oxo acid dehydrogenase subunit E2 [Pseudomonadota bacterium]